MALTEREIAYWVGVFELQIIIVSRVHLHTSFAHSRESLIYTVKALVRYFTLVLYDLECSQGEGEVNPSQNNIAISRMKRLDMRLKIL